MTLSLIRGIPGSGKSTLAAKMHQQCMVHFVFEADQYFMKDGEYKFDRERLGDAHRECQLNTARWLKEHANVAVANTFTKWSEMRPYIDLAFEFDRPIQIIEMTNSYGSIHGVPVETLNVMKDRFLYQENFRKFYKEHVGREFDGIYLYHK